MAKIFNEKNIFFELKQSPIPEFSWHTSQKLSGNATLRTPDGFTELKEGDIAFFEIGPNGAHQLYNNNKQPCKFLDLSTDLGIDICEYPDSGKINILPYEEVFQSKEIVDYYKGEEKVGEKWIIEDRT